MRGRLPFILAAMAAAVAIAACDSRPVSPLPDDDEPRVDASPKDAGDAGDAEGG